MKLAAAEKDPNFLALSPDRHFLFAALNDQVASFAIQPGGTLLAINHQPSGGDDTCHVSLDLTGHQLFSASYGGGSIAAFPVDAKGKIGARTALITFAGSGPNLERQEGPHAHSVYVDPENHFLYACDLGSDRIWIFRLGGKGKLIAAEPPSVKVGPGSGPRHLMFSPDGKLVYVANELGVTTSVFARNASTGALTMIDTIDNIKPGWPKGTGSAEISLHPSGKWLYVSTRLEDAMTVFKINRTASSGSPTKPLDREQVIASPVRFPRSFALDPTGRWLVIAGQMNNRISVMKVDSASGRLTPTNEYATVGSPVCVLFAPIAGSGNRR